MDDYWLLLFSILLIIGLNKQKSFFCTSWMLLKPFLFYLFLVLRFAKRNMRLPWIFIKISAAVGTIDNIYVMFLIQHVFFLFSWHVIFIHSHFDMRSQSNWLCFPFRNITPFLCLLLIFSNSIFLEQFLMLLRDDPLVLGIELFPLFLKNFPADDFMLLYTIWMKFSSATLAASH